MALPARSEGIESSPRRAEGERALMHALLVDAIHCLLGEGAPAAQRARLAAEARAWIENAGTHSWTLSFEDVCGFLNVSPARLRRKLLAMAAEAAQRRANATAHVRRTGTAEHRARAERNRRIRELRKAGWKPRQLAERFGLHYAYILLICAQQDTDAEDRGGEGEEEVHGQDRGRDDEERPCADPEEEDVLSVRRNTLPRFEDAQELVVAAPAMDPAALGETALARHEQAAVLA
jgi:hypothetical protein